MKNLYPSFLTDHRCATVWHVVNTWLSARIKLWETGQEHYVLARRIRFGCRVKRGLDCGMMSLPISRFNRALCSGVALPLLSAISLLALIAASPTMAASRADNIPAPVVDAPLPPPVNLSLHVVESASEYREYMRHASAMATHFENGQAIEATLTDAEAYEPQQLVRGAVAYGAVVALQDPAFVAGVRVYAANSAMRKDLADRIISDPNYATVMPGAATAANMIMATMYAHGQKMADLGSRIRLSAYDVQKLQPWSKGYITDREGRLARAKAVSAAPMTPVPEEVRKLANAVTGSEEFATMEVAVSQTVEPANPPFTPFVARSLAIAALAALGEGGDENETALEGLLNDSSAGFCLNMSKLNLYQCLAVAKPWYEDMFCLGLHALADTGQCISKAAGTPSMTAQNTTVAPAPGRTTDVASAAQTTPPQR